MVQEFLQVSYDPTNKIWSSLKSTDKDQVQGSIGEKFLKTMRRSSIDPNKIIDEFYDTNCRKTAKEVYEQSIIVATNLRRLGVEKNDVVVLFCMNNEDVAVLTMGCVLIGAIVNFFEVHMEDEHIDYVFNILRPKMILYEEKYKEKCLQSVERKNLKSCKFLISIDGYEQGNVKTELMTTDINIRFDKFESVEIRDPQNEVAIYALTSGSTGIPKIVQLTHTLTLHGCYIWWTNRSNYEPLNDESVVFSFSPLRWISQCMMLFQSMLMGIKRVSCCGPTTGIYGLELLRKSQLSHVFVAPSIFHEILLQLDVNDMDSLKSLKVVQMGGEAPSKMLLQSARKYCRNAKIFQCYGMTEMATCIATDEYINCGKLLPGYQVQILDADNEPLGPNENGQIAIKPPYPLKDYKDIDCRTIFNKIKFFINGDYGFVDDTNNLHILARYKDLIYSNNLVASLIPNKLEHIVMELPEICAARLAGYRRSTEEANEMASFFVVLQKGVTISQAEVSKKILSTLKLQLQPEELAVIKDIYYVNSIPVTTCGKVDRVALKNLALKKSQNK